MKYIPLAFLVLLGLTSDFSASTTTTIDADETPGAAAATASTKPALAPPEIRTPAEAPAGKKITLPLLPSPKANIPMTGCKSARWVLSSCMWPGGVE